MCDAGRTQLDGAKAKKKKKSMIDSARGSPSERKRELNGGGARSVGALWGPPGPRYTLSYGNEGPSRHRGGRERGRERKRVSSSAGMTAGKQKRGREAAE